MEMPDFNEEIRHQVDYWKRILALQDWNTEVRVCRQWEMENPHVIAQVDHNLRKKDAIIKVLSPKDLDGHLEMSINGEERDYDVHLAHELLHLHFAPLKLEGEANEILEEQAVHAISRGLVTLYRRKQKQEQAPPAPETLTDTAPSTGHYF